MRLKTAPGQAQTSSCNTETCHISAAVPFLARMTSVRSTVKPLVAGLILTLAQIAAAVCRLAPEGPLSHRYATLIQHDSFWFMNIVDRGYQTTVPPVNHKVMEVSNVAFFPAYPAIAGLLRRAFDLETEKA